MLSNYSSYITKKTKKNNIIIRSMKMFGLEYLLAALKILVNVGFAIVTAIPAKIAWNCVAPTYLNFIPEVYHHIPYWHMVAILLVCTFVGEQIRKLIPPIISTSS